MKQPIGFRRRPLSGPKKEVTLGCITDLERNKWYSRLWTLTLKSKVPPDSLPGVASILPPSFCPRASRLLLPLLERSVLISQLINNGDLSDRVFEMNSKSWGWGCEPAGPLQCPALFAPSRPVSDHIST